MIIWMLKMTWLFESIILSKKLYLQTSWYWIVFESIVSSKNCISRVIDFQIFFRCTICSKFDHSTWLFKSIVLSNKLHLQNIKRVAISIWLFELIASSKKLHLSCYWFSNTFSLYNMFVTWLFFRDCFLSMSMFYKLIREFY